MVKPAINDIIADNTKVKLLLEFPVSFFINEANYLNILH